MAKIDRELLNFYDNPRRITSGGRYSQGHLEIYRRMGILKHMTMQDFRFPDLLPGASIATWAEDGDYNIGVAPHCIHDLWYLYEPSNGSDGVWTEDELINKNPLDEEDEVTIKEMAERLEKSPKIRMVKFYDGFGFEPRLFSSRFELWNPLQTSEFSIEQPEKKYEEADEKIDIKEAVGFYDFPIG
ncbi:MAG: hypothetical protein ABIJ08_05005 [Nanoarchaeota archaeon]